jgi:hypothetical protein
MVVITLPKAKLTFERDLELADRTLPDSLANCFVSPPSVPEYDCDTAFIRFTPYCERL